MVIEEEVKWFFLSATLGSQECSHQRLCSNWSANRYDSRNLSAFNDYLSGSMRFFASSTWALGVFPSSVSKSNFGFYVTIRGRKSIRLRFTRVVTRISRFSEIQFSATTHHLHDSREKWRTPLDFARWVDFGFFARSSKTQSSQAHGFITATDHVDDGCIREAPYQKSLF